MKKTFFSLLAALLLASSSFAQADYSRGEVFIGYSHGLVDGSTSRFVKTSNDFGDIGPLKFPGVNVAGTYNISRYVGIRGDVSASFHGGDFVIPISTTTQ
jgi:hypothetical protein